MNDEVIEYLVAHRFSVMLSIDGPPELSDIHRRDLGGKGVGNKAVANGRKLIAAQKLAGITPAQIRSTMTHENHDSALLHKYFAEQGFTRVMLGVAGGRSTEKGPWDVTEEDAQEMSRNFDGLIEQYVQWLDGVGEMPLGANALPRTLDKIREGLTNPKTTGSIGCGVGRNMQAITKDGKIYPCHRYAGEDEFLLGTIDEGLNLKAVKKYYEEVIRVGEEHCSGCWARMTCGGQCAWYISKSDGTIPGPDEASCNGIRSGHERLLWLMHELHSRERGPKAASQAI